MNLAELDEVAGSADLTPHSAAAHFIATLPVELLWLTAEAISATIFVITKDEECHVQ